MFDDKEPDANGKKTIGNYELLAMGLRSRYNPEQVYYIVNVAEFISFGLDADDIFDVVYNRYIESGYQPLDELYEHIERRMIMSMKLGIEGGGRLEIEDDNTTIASQDIARLIKDSQELPDNKKEYTPSIIIEVKE